MNKIIFTAEDARLISEEVSALKKISCEKEEHKNIMKALPKAQELWENIFLKEIKKAAKDGRWIYYHNDIIFKDMNNRESELYLTKAVIHLARRAGFLAGYGIRSRTYYGTEYFFEIKIDWKTEN